MSLKDFLSTERASLPNQPGVYIFRDCDGGAIYVGKAKAIRKRVQSHASRPATADAEEMVTLIDHVEFVVTRNEAEALITEQSLIRQYRPRFNIRLRDDKSYPYIGVSLDECYPRVYFTREKRRRGRAYFGPYSSARSVRQTLDVLARVFQYRTCSGTEPGRASGSPCLDYHIKRCQAPCVEYISAAEYRENIGRIMGFLAGRYGEVRDELELKMSRSAASQEYEQAAIFRNRLQAITSLMERHRVGGRIGSLDVVGAAVEGDDANVQVLQVRDDVLADRLSFYVDRVAGRQLNEVVEQFLEQHYMNVPAVPGEIVVPQGVGTTAALAAALKLKRGSAVNVHVAERGEKRRMAELAVRNARLALAQDKLRREHGRQRRADGLAGLQEALGLDTLPVRIETYDVSNLGAAHTVASMVVFQGGSPHKSDYRRFVIRSLSGQDDYAAMEEVLGRRMSRYLEEQDRSPYDAERDDSFAALPQLIVIDGGKGQLASGLKALKEFTDRGVPVVSLAKRLEEVFVPGRKRPIVLPHDRPALQLLQRMRDEAHRFAVTHHRRRRDRAMTASVFDELPGVGPARKRLMLRHFGSPDAVLKASRAELEAVPGLPGKVARQVHEQLNRTG